jgi:hypothetical protein
MESLLSIGLIVLAVLIVAVSLPLILFSKLNDTRCTNPQCGRWAAGEVIRSWSLREKYDSWYYDTTLGREQHVYSVDILKIRKCKFCGHKYITVDGEISRRPWYSTPSAQKSELEKLYEKYNTAKLSETEKQVVLARMEDLIEAESSKLDALLSSYNSSVSTTSGKKKQTG